MYAPEAAIEDGSLYLSGEEDPSYEHDDCVTDDASTLRRLYEHPLLSADEEKELFLARGTKRWGQAKERLVLSNMRLVKAIASRYQWVEGCELDDIVQHGVIGLMNALERFDPERDLHLSTYAVYWINQEIRTNLVNKRGQIRLPAYMREAAARIGRARADLEKEGVSHPSDEQVAQRCGMAVRRVRKTMDAVSMQTLSLNSPIGFEDETELGDLVASSEDVEQDAVKRVLLERVLMAMEQLLPAERKVILMRYGMYKGRKMSLAECAQELGCSSEGCRQAQRRAEEKLRAMCNRKKRRQG